MKKRIYVCVLIAVAFLMAFSLSSCKGKEITVTFNGNGGSLVEGMETQTVKEGDSVTPPIYEKAGYALSWEGFSFDELAENATISPIWTPVVYTITYELDGGINNAENPSTYTVESQAITLKSPTKATRVFAGFSEGNTIPPKSTGNKTFTAIWTPAQYTYTFFDEDGSTVLKTALADYGSEIALPNDEPTKAATTQYTYTFSGWDKNIPETLTENITFTAVFSETIQQYLVTYEETDMPASTLYYSDTIERPVQDPTRPDHIFYGWYTSASFQTEYRFGDPIAGNIKIYARFGRLDFIEAEDGSGYFVYSRYTYQGNNVVIPSTYRGRQVVGIHDVFRNAPIESVVLPEGLITIGDSAFYGCESLISVTLPSTLQTIGSSAFGGTESLTEINLPNGLLSIGDYAFSRSGLERISIPSSVNSIGNYAFRMCSTLQEANIANGVQTLGNLAFSQTGVENVIVPGSIKEVGEMAFFACHSLETIIFEIGVKTIGKAAVNQCEELIQVTLPDGLLSIGEDAFLGTTKLTNIDIPLTVTEILDGAFSTSGIAKITIPGSVRTISNSLFSHCEDLVDITILEGVETIEYNAFYNCGFKTLILPESIKTIEEMAFRYIKFDALVIGSGLTTLNKSICDRYAEITIKNTIPPILAEGAEYNSFYVPSASLQTYKTAERWSVLERFIKKMPKVNFETNCSTSLDYIEVPYGISVGEIEELTKAHYIFDGWYSDSGFTTVFDLNTAITQDTTLYAKWTEVLGTDGLSYELTNGDTEYAITSYNGTSKSIYIPSQYQGLPLTSIAPGAFSGTTITDVFMANNIKTIGANCFDSCSSLESITFSTSLETIGNDAFGSCRLTSLVLPASVTNIGSNAFINCVQITGNILIPKNVTTIGSTAFRNVYANITFEENSLLTTLENSAFANFKGNLTNLPNNLQVIQGSAFSQASNIISLVIPSSVTTIGSYAFNNSVTQITFAQDSQLETLDSNAFRKYKGTTITLPKSLLNIGVEAFKDYSGAILFEENSTMTNIGEQAFKGYLGAALALPEDIISIGTGAFRYCSNLISISFGSKIETIGEFAFEGCIILTDIVLPTSVTTLKRSCFDGVTSDISFATDSVITTIGQSAFNGYKGEKIILPEGITTISPYAFDGCNMLTELVIPESVNSIGESAFVGVNCSLSFAEESQLATVKAKAFRGYNGNILTLPQAVTSIENLAFTECINLESLIIKSIIPPNVPNSVAIFDVDSDINIYVYSESLESYKTDSYFGSYAEKIFTLCRVEFYLTEGSSIKIEVLEGCIVMVPDPQTREGFTFDSWYTDDIYTTLYDFTEPVLSDRIIYAKWVAV